MKRFFACLFFLCLNGSAVAADYSNSLSHATSVSSNGSGAVTVLEVKGDVQTQQRVLDAYSAIEIAAPVIVDYSGGDAASLSITAPSDAMAYLITDVEDEKLTIRFKDNTSITLHDPIRIKASGHTLHSVVISSAGEFYGAAIRVPKLEVLLAGSAKAAIFGQAEEVDATVSGAGNADISGIHAKKISLTVSGAGRARAFASEEADANVSGTGQVVISGHPQKRDIHVSDAGHVNVAH